MGSCEDQGAVNGRRVSIATTIAQLNALLSRADAACSEATAAEIRALVASAMSDLQGADGEYRDSLNWDCHFHADAVEDRFGAAEAHRASGMEKYDQAVGLLNGCYAGGGGGGGGGGGTVPTEPQPTAPGKADGDLSPGGQWTWNGTDWVTTDAYKKAAADKQRNLLIIVGVAIVAVVLMVVGFLFVRGRKREG